MICEILHICISLLVKMNLSGKIRYILSDIVANILRASEHIVSYLNQHEWVFPEFTAVWLLYTPVACMYIIPIV